MLGPTFIHLYDINDCQQYVGRVCLELISECLEIQPTHDLAIKDIVSLDEKLWWEVEPFVVEFMAHQGDFVRGNFSNCKITLRMAGEFCLATN